MNILYFYPHEVPLLPFRNTLTLTFHIRPHIHLRIKIKVCMTFCVSIYTIVSYKSIYINRIFYLLLCDTELAQSRDNNVIKFHTRAQP